MTIKKIATSDLKKINLDNNDVAPKLKMRIQYQGFPTSNYINQIKGSVPQYNQFKYCESWKHLTVLKFGWCGKCCVQNVKPAMLAKPVDILSPSLKQIKIGWQFTDKLMAVPPIFL